LPVCLPVVFFSPASKKNKVGGQSRLEQLQETHHSRTFFLRLLRCCWKEKEKKKKRGLQDAYFPSAGRAGLSVFSSFFKWVATLEIRDRHICWLGKKKKILTK
jgi:hypothetical protein